MQTSNITFGQNNKIEIVGDSPFVKDLTQSLVEYFTKTKTLHVTEEPKSNAEYFQESPSKNYETLFTYHTFKRSGDKMLLAKGYKSEKGFVVQKGASVWKKYTLKNRRRVTILRERLIKDETLILEDDNTYFLTDDVTFLSSHEAACFVHGNSRNGFICWVNERGIPMGELKLNP